MVSVQIPSLLYVAGPVFILTARCKLEGFFLGMKRLTTESLAVRVRRRSGGLDLRYIGGVNKLDKKDRE